jgi:hypothetical protein
MKKIREGVFETNSSSTHSVVIAKGSEQDLTQLPTLDINGNLQIEPGEYGWEVVEYNSVEDKLSYAATYALNYGDIDILTELLKEYTGAFEINYIDGGYYYDKGYIDHQSVDEAASIFENKESLINFLFNPGSYFETDNDNR